MTYPKRLTKYMTTAEYRDRLCLIVMIKSQKEMQWLLYEGINSTEMVEFKKLLKRVENICCDNVYIENYIKEKYDSFLLDMASMVVSHSYLSFLLICNILRYKKWNQYYYSEMTDKELLNIIVLQIKKSNIEDRKESVERIFV